MEDEDDHPAPMELGTARSGGSGGSGGGTQPAQWLRWAALGGALVVGAVVGVVADNARDDAAEYGEVDLVRGTVFVETAPPLATGPQTMTVNLINTGPREVEIVGLTIAGFDPATGSPGATGTVDPDSGDVGASSSGDGDGTTDDAEEAVTAAPGTWVAARTTVTADCETRPPGTIEVRVRTGSGERTVVIEGQPGDDQLIWAWQYGCDASPESGVFVGDTRTVSSDARGAEIVLPINNGTDQPVRILRLEGITPGFTLTASALPLDIPAGELVEVSTTWSVDDCEAAARFTDATVAVNVGSGDMESRITQPLGNPTLIELVRLAVRVCET